MIYFFKLYLNWNILFFRKKITFLMKILKIKALIKKQTNKQRENLS